MGQVGNEEYMKNNQASISGSETYAECFDRDRDYWNRFYKGEVCGTPSLFSQFALKFMETGKSLLDIGCGNGRDSIFFASNGLKVIGIDASNVAIENLLAKGNMGNVSFLCDDFVTSALYRRKFDYCYSRFSIHAVTLNQQETLLKNIYDCLNDQGKLFVEARSIHDELYGKGSMIEKDTYVYNGHFRRFIKLEELVDNLHRLGFRILSSDEKRGFAPFGEENPPIIRVIAVK